MEISYRLTQAEAFTALTALKKFRPYKNKSIAYTIGFGIGAVLFGGSIFISAKNVTNYIVFAICVVGIVAVWTLPKRNQLNRAKNAADGTEIRIEVIPEKILVKTSRVQWELPLDGFSLMVEAENVVAIELPTGRVLAIPDRVLGEESLEFIRNGTHS